MANLCWEKEIFIQMKILSLQGKNLVTTLMMEEQLKILLQILSYSDGPNNILDIIEKNNLKKK